MLDKPFIYTVGLVVYANSLSGCIQPMSDGMGREFAYLSSHATNRYFIPNWVDTDENSTDAIHHTRMLKTPQRK